MGLFNFFSGLGNTSFDDWISGAASAKASVAATKDLDEWRAKNLPKMQMSGYRDAGLNPILVGDYSSGSGGSVSAGGGNYGAAVDAAEAVPAVTNSAVNAAKAVMNLLPQTEEQQSKTEKAKYEAMTAKSDYQRIQGENFKEQLKNDAEIEAMSGIISPNITSMNDIRTYNELVQAYKNDIERSRYQNSREHAIFEDANTSAKTAIQLFGRGKAKRHK